MTHYTVDAKNLLCPMPVIRLQNKVRELAAKDTVEITCTDPGVLQDIPAWCRVHGHKVLNCLEEDREIRITIVVQ